MIIFGLFFPKDIEVVEGWNEFNPKTEKFTQSVHDWEDRNLYSQVEFSASAIKAIRKGLPVQLSVTIYGLVVGDTGEEGRGRMVIQTEPDYQLRLTGVKLEKYHTARKAFYEHKKHNNIRPELEKALKPLFEASRN